MGPYNDGRYTACISSQVGCAQGCVFCATGQMGFIRQLSEDEIFEQVSIFHSYVLSLPSAVTTTTTTDSKNNNNNNKLQHQHQHNKPKRLSNIVFMGMGEPLANYKNVIRAVRRITSELGIGARHITISTVGIVPIINKITQHSIRRPQQQQHPSTGSSSSSSTQPSKKTKSDLQTNDNDEILPQFRLAISLHCATEDERTQLLPANARNGGLNALMEALYQYCSTTGRRITIEWALIAGQNDSVQTAHQLGRLLTKHPQYPLRPDLVHVNVIPLNPTTEYAGTPSRPNAVNLFCQTLIEQYKISCTPRVRRGIDIDAGCGQLTTKYIQQQEQQNQEVNVSTNGTSSISSSPPTTLKNFIPPSVNRPVAVGVYEDDDDGDDYYNADHDAKQPVN